MSEQRAQWKREAAEHAVTEIKSGMIVGLGSGSTAAYALKALAAKLTSGELNGIKGIPTSLIVEKVARELGVPLTTFDENPQLDLTIDGADEVDPELNLIKGGGGALLREKIVAQASLREIIVLDESKLSDRLGSKSALPVEVLKFGWELQAAFLERLGASVALRKNEDDEPFVTDEGNCILDCDFGPIKDVNALANAMDGRAGIVEHGLFIGLATEVMVGGAEGVRALKPHAEGKD
jgi:ribose 5-phosphate isomerase A